MRNIIYIESRIYYILYLEYGDQRCTSQHPICIHFNVKKVMEIECTCIRLSGQYQKMCYILCKSVCKLFQKIKTSWDSNKEKTQNEVGGFTVYLTCSRGGIGTLHMDSILQCAIEYVSNVNGEYSMMCCSK